VNKIKKEIKQNKISFLPLIKNQNYGKKDKIFLKFQFHLKLLIIDLVICVLFLTNFFYLLIMTEFFELFSQIPIDFLDWSYEFLKTVPWYSVLIFAMFITFLENIFPPSPSDVLLVFMGTLVSVGTVDFISLLVMATTGSTFGFLVMYLLGDKFETKIIDSDKLPFITKKQLEKPEQWFRKYGYYIIVANRFLSGTRAVISFFAGMSKLDLIKTTILSSISALIWNAILIMLGILFADNLELVKHYIAIYGKIVFPIIILLILIISLKYIFFNGKNKVVEE